MTESFACDGQPGSHADIDHADVVALFGHKPAPGRRSLHRVAAGVSLEWELLARGAQTTRDADLLELAERCHPWTLRQKRWANSMLKILAPQILASRPREERGACVSNQQQVVSIL
ncbi:hypothetical protein [Nocardia rhamnosiphila]